MRIACIAVAGTALLVATLAGADDSSRLRAIGEGRALYLTHCASCHGPAGAGLAGHDLTAIARRDGTFSRLHVANRIQGSRDGVDRRAMPSWHAVFVHSWPGGDGPAMLTTRKLVRYLEFVQAAPPTTVATTEPR